MFNIQYEPGIFNINGYFRVLISRTKQNNTVYAKYKMHLVMIREEFNCTNRAIDKINKIR